MDKRLSSILACPKCKNNIEVKKNFIVCKKCKLAYPILGDIPNMLIEESWKLEKAKKNKFKHNLKF